MKFLLFVFWCIVIVYVLGLVGRLLLRGFVSRKVREFEKAAGGQQARTGGRARRKPEGEVTVERIAEHEKQVSGKVGEYVEFEEIEEDKK